MGPDLVDIAANKLENHLAQRQAPRVFESIGDQAVQQLAPLFEHAVKRGDVNVEAVARQLGETLEGPLAPEFFLEDDFARALEGIGRLEQAITASAPGSQYARFELEPRLEALRSELFPPKTMEEAEALASAGDVVVPSLKYHRDNAENEVAASVRTLRLIASPKARARLREYLEDPRQAVVEELAQAINPLEIRAVQERLLAGEDLSAGIRSRISDLSPLASLSSMEWLYVSEEQMLDPEPLKTLKNLKVRKANQLNWFIDSLAT